MTSLNTDSFDLKKAEDDLLADPSFRVARNALATTSIRKIARNREVVASLNHTVKVKIDTWKVADQKRSGRCWIFAGLNLLRAQVMAKTGIPDFELSQNYLYFWDKLEKANYFLCAMEDLAGRDLRDRTVDHLLRHPIEDGGQWAMFVALIEKYGVVPKYAMPETYSSSNTASLNRDLEHVLRRGALRMREGQSQAKEETLAQVFRILTVHLGTPPKEFLWQYRDKDKKFYREGLLTPQDFAASSLDDVSSNVCLVNDPRHPYGKRYTVEYLGNVVGSDQITYLNVPSDVLQDAVRQQLDTGHPVWFGCDTLAQSDSENGIWDAHLFAYEDIYGVSWDLDKKSRLERGDSMMTHAMVFTGYGEDAQGHTLYRVENSWGPDKAQQGFWTMTQSWFQEYVFEVAVPASILPTSVQAGLTTEITSLPVWDPMGALASGRFL